MRVVVADTGPLRYLAQIDHLGLLARLFGKVFIPSVVHRELLHASAPEAVRSAIGAKPDWLEIIVTDVNDDPSLSALDPGERAAIALGLALPADLILIDDRRGAKVARDKGFEVAGTLGILDLAARRGMIDLGQAVNRLRATNFRLREELLDDLLNKHRQSEP